MAQAHPVQLLLDAKNLIEQALPDETPEARLQMVGLILLGPAQSDRSAPQYAAAPKRQARQPQAGTKADQLVAMLKRPKGVTLDEVIKTFGIQKKSAYARISVVSRAAKLKVKHEDGRYVAA